jgi:large subunit ribosomal protein L31
LIFCHNRRFSTLGKWLAAIRRAGLATDRYQGKTMKEGIHPNYREVLFVDMSNDFKFITRSTINTRETGEFEGKTYPLAKIEVSSESHPFYTGNQKIMDTAGRVEKFNKKFAAFSAKK